MKRAYLPLIILVTCFSFCSSPKTPGTLDLEIETIVKRYMDSLGLAGISISVTQNNEIKFKESFGYANLENRMPMSDSSVYRIWSVSKQFCAVSIFKLEEQGLLGIDASISNYLDSIPDTWEDITIRQLLNHTAGIKDYLNDYPEGEKLHSIPFEEVVDSIRVLQFTPGSDWSYSNSGYWVLTRIVEAITQKPYQEYLQNEFFSPFQMPNTQKMDYFSIISNRVNGYRNVDGAFRNSTRYLDENHVANGDGELLSTSNDLTNWIQALFTGQAIEPNLLEKAWERSNYDNGDHVDASSIIYYDSTASYGMGWFISDLNGHKIAWTPGAGRGFSTTIFSVPSLELNIIVLCNSRRFLIADKIAKEIANSIIDNN